MLPLKTLIFFTLVAATSFAHPGHASIWGQRVFPDDESPFSSHAKHKVEDSGAETNDIKHEIVCRTRECKQIADEFLSSMNKSLDPCHDFWDFACGGWPTNNPIPPHMDHWSAYAIFENLTNFRVKGILETKPETSDILPVRQAKKWFRSCMDIKKLEERGIKPIESILTGAGGWPISMDEEEWDSEANTWQKVESSYARLTRSYTFLDVHNCLSDGDVLNCKDLTIAPQRLPLGEDWPGHYRDYNDNGYNTYVNLVTAVADAFAKRHQANVSKEKIIKEAEDIVEFEKNIYELQTGGYGEMTFEEFIDWYNNNVTEANEDTERTIDWRLLVQSLFDSVNIDVDPDTKVILTDIDYIKGIGELLRETPPRTVVNYIHWHFIEQMLPYTSEQMRNDLFKIVNKASGKSKRPERWAECAAEMKMTHAASYAFVKKYFGKNRKTAALKMIKNIQIAMNAQIENSNWLDEESKILAKDKLNSMKIFIGFPDWYQNKTAVINFYRGLNIGSDHFDNSLSYMRYKRKVNLKNYGPDVEVDKTRWWVNPLAITSEYRIVENNINIPAADFQSPLFTRHLPDNVNYGVAGAIVGHEMGHGFDNDGIRYGEDGNETKLSESMLTNYYKRANCFIDQYNEYYGETRDPETTEIIPNSEETVLSKSRSTWAENIADSSGLQTVFEAYRKHKKSETSLKLPGLEEFTDDQLFFVSFAGASCEIQTPEYAELIKAQEYHDHSPEKLRVIGAVSNTKGFAEVFNCPLGSPMNPINKCSIWGKSGITPLKIPSKMKRRHNRRYG